MDISSQVFRTTDTTTCQFGLFDTLMEILLVHTTFIIFPNSLYFQWLWSERSGHSGELQYPQSHFLLGVRLRVGKWSPFHKKEFFVLLNMLLCSLKEYFIV